MGAAAGDSAEEEEEEPDDSLGAALTIGCDELLAGDADVDGGALTIGLTLERLGGGLHFGDRWYSGVSIVGLGGITVSSFRVRYAIGI